MKKVYEDIKLILSGLSEVSEIQLNRLFDVYGVDAVKKVMQILNNDSIGLTSVDSEESNDDELKTSFDYYISDISGVVDISLEDKKVMIEEIVEIVKYLKEILDRVSIDVISSRGKKAWLCDKVVYCNEFCNDSVLVEKVNILYKKYVDKRNLLIESNLKFVISIAVEYFNESRGLDLDELVQYGNMGLIRAFETYDTSFNTDFLTYASYWIKQSIILNSKKTMNYYKVPIYLYSLYSEKMNAIEVLSYKLGRSPTDLEIAEFMGISLKKLRILSDAFLPILSLDESLDTSIDGLSITRIECIPDETIDLERDLELYDMSSELHSYMCDVLDDRERFILRNRYGFDDMNRVEDIARELKISSQRVYQLSDRAIGKLIKAKGFRNMRMYLR